MKKTVFLFDLDGTITLEETLPKIAKHFNITEDIDRLTIETLNGNIPFVESFIRRVNILKSIPVSLINTLLLETQLAPLIIDFIHKNREQCYIVTGNLSEWVNDLSLKIGCPAFTSKGLVVDDQLIELTEILKKEDIVKQFQQMGYRVVFIGDSNNDCEAMRLADVSIACGITHYPAMSVMTIADYAVFDEKSICRLLTQLQYQPSGKSIVISCAGIGSRLGLGQTKALIELNGKKLIEIQLEYFRAIEDIRIVVGFQCHDIIKTVLNTRKDIIFVFNHDYFHTKTGASFYLGARHANEYAIAWDGDLLVHPDDIEKCLNSSGEYVGCSEVVSCDPVFVIQDEKNQAIGFSYEKGSLEWSGPACLKSAHIVQVSSNVFNQIEPLLPISILKIRAQDIDTFEDYENAKKFVKGW